MEKLISLQVIWLKNNVLFQIKSIYCENNKKKICLELVISTFLCLMDTIELCVCVCESVMGKKQKKKNPKRLMDILEQYGLVGCGL